MLRPYAVIIKDSFREALASRVLWILLSLVTWLLLALAPMGYQEKVVIDLRHSDIADWRILVKRLVAAEEGTAHAAVQCVWSNLEEPAQNSFRELAAKLRDKPGAALKFDQRAELLRALNAAIGQRDLDDKSSWDELRLPEETANLREQPAGRLSPQKLKRRNRLLLEAAFPQLILRSPSDMVEFSWLFWKMPKALPMSREILRERVDLGLTFIMQYVVGIVAVFIAILVTAPIVPQTFTSGSLNLLLSKPLFRSLLFLTKYAGGCAFVLLVSGYLIAGLWLISGFRFGVWHPRLLYAIPIFAFLFSIYYAVSALAGVLWKNAIVSIVLTVMLWSLLVVVAWTKVLVDGFYVKPFRLTKLISAKETMVAVNEAGLVYAWNDGQAAWQVIFGSDESPGMAALANAVPGKDMLGPVYHAAGDQLIALPQGMGDFGAMGIGPKLSVGRRADDWRRTESVTAPSDIKAIHVDAAGEVLLISTEGVFRIAGELSQDEEQPTLFGVELPAQQQSPFISLGPAQPLELDGRNTSIAVNRDTGQIAIFHRGQLRILALEEEDSYRIAHEFSLGNPQDRLLLAFAGNSLCVAHAKGIVEIRDPETGEIRHTIRPEATNQPRFVSAAPGGRYFAVTYQHRRIAVVDAEQGRSVPHRLTGQGDISAAEFNPQGELLVADRTNRVTVYDVSSLRRLKVFAPRQDMLERSYRYAILPLYWLLPKPGELSHTVYYLLTQRKSAGMSTDLASPQKAIDPWAPVLSSLAFVAVVLAVACVYLERSDF